MRETLEAFGHGRVYNYMFSLINQNEIMETDVKELHRLFDCGRRNSSVPGISNKLDPPLTRKLNLLIRYWKTILDLAPIRDIYGHEVLIKR